jgi:hypothetical protein
MGCALTTEQYIPVVENLIKLNPETYRNFDNAAKFILEADLTDEQKKLALHNMAHIYNGLSGLDEKKYSIGKGIDIINSVTLIDNTGEYVKNAFAILEVKRPRLQTFEGISSEIDKLAKQTLITPQDLNAPLALLKNYINTHNFENLAAKTEALDQIRGAIKDVISNLKTDNSYKQVLYNMIDNYISQFNSKSEYIPLSSVADEAQLSNILVTFSDGTMAEAMEIEGVLYQVSDDGSVVELDMTNVINKKEARPAEWTDANDGKQVFKEDFLLSGLTITAINPEEHISVMDELNKMASPSSGIKITAVKLSEVGDMRVERMKEIAATDQEKASLVNREHETFENSTQIAYLESTPDGKVLTVSRPKASEQDFALVGEILSTGAKFHIYSMDNFVFVSSDNTTERLDINNPGHVQLLKAMSLKKVGTVTEEMQDSDLTSLAASIKLFEEFKEKIAYKIQTAFLSDTSVEVTDEFLQMYDFTNSRSGNKTKTVLKDAIAKNPQFSKKVNVVTLDANGDVINDEERQLPFYFTKDIDFKLKSVVFKQVKFLGGNERIKMVTPDGKVVYLTEFEYANDILNLEEQLTMVFKKENERLIDLVNKGQSLYRVPKTTQFVVKFRPDGTISYASVDRVPQLENPEFFAKFITVVSDVISNQQKGVTKGKAVQAMDRNTYQFLPKAVKGGKGYAISINFDVSAPMPVPGSPIKQSKLQIEIRPYSRGEAANKYQKIIVDSGIWKAFNIILPEAEINKLAKTLKEGPTVQKVKSEVPALAKLDLNKPEELLQFYTAVFDLSKLPSTPDSVKSLATVVDMQQDMFTELVLNTLTKRFKDNPVDPETGKGVYDDFLAALKEDFGDNFEIENLFAYENAEGRMILNILSPDSPGDTYAARSTYNRSMKNIVIVESEGRRSFQLVSKAAVNVSKTDEASENKDLTQDEKAIVDEVAEKENAAVKVTPDNPIDAPVPLSDTGQQDVTDEGKTDEETTEDDDITDIPPFSIAVDTDFEVATEQDILSEAEWLAENLPQFGIDTSSLRDVINLSRIDGTVLGMFKDKVIYLNDVVTAKGTVFHEAFHGVFRYLLSESERKNLIKQVMDDPKHAAKFSAANVQDFARMRNLSVTNYDTLVELIAEEILADGFQNYMKKDRKSAPKTAMQRFFDMLKRLINFFVRNRNQIDYVYDRVKRGYYKTASIKSNIYDGQVAYEIVPGLKQYYLNEQGNVVRAKSVLSPGEQEQLLNMIVGVMFKDNIQSDTFEERFQRAANKILDEIYSMEKLVAQNPEKRDLIEQKYSKLISTYRFVLGARMQGKNVNDINLTGDTRFDNKTEANREDLINGETIDNTMGQYSFEVLRRLAKDKYDKANSVKIQRDNDEFTLDSEEVEETFTGETANEVQDDEKASAQEELENNDFDAGMGEQNRMDSYVSQIRRFFSTLRSDQFDEETGVNFPRMIDGQVLFPTLLKITAGIQPKNIIDTIGIMSEQMIKDGFVQVGNDLKIIYDEIQTRTKANKEGVAQSNKQLLKLITEVLHGVELNYVMYNVASPKKISMEEAEGSNLDAALSEQDVTFRMFDKVMDADITKKRNDVIANFIKKHSTQATSPEFLEAVAYLKQFATSFMSSPDILSSITGQTMKLQQLTDKVHEAMTTIGLTVPRSLVQLSIMAMNVEENNIPLEVDEKLQKFYDVNDSFVKQQQYLEKDFFKSLKVVLDAAYLESGKPNSGIRNILDDEKTRNTDAKRMLLILKKASAYSVKYDPTDIPSVIKNAEGKSIYRFAKYNPLILLGQKLNTMTLEEALADDPYFTNTLKAFLEDNPLFGGLLTGKTDRETERMKVFLQNFTVAMFGGVQQRIGDVAKKGQTFKSVDERSLHMLQILAFMDRKTFTNKAGDSVTTYFRSFHQLEATSTNFLISALYEPFTSKDKKQTNDKGQLLYQGKYLKIVEDLVQIVGQEYNRMSREWARRLDLKRDYENGISNELINKYNAILEEDGVTVNVDDASLRAYKFNILSDFFDTDENASLRDDLIDLAKNQIPFTEIDPNALFNALDEYAKKEFQTYLEKLENLGLISKTPIPIGKDIVDPRPGAKVKYPTEYYTSDMLPKTISEGYGKTNKSKIAELYNQPYGAKADSALDPIENMLFDMFMGNWRNGLHVNQLMDGDMALNVKNAQDYVKRLKKIVASGSNMKDGTHKVAYMNTITAFIHEQMPQYGPYYTRDEIVTDFTIPNETVREQLLEGYDKSIDGTKESINGRVVNWGDMMREVFDGQSISTLMHQMDMHETLGRLDERGLYILIAKHYRGLTQEETKYLESMKIVNNAKKTITADRNIYHKLSEGYIDRTDVSRLLIEPRTDESMADATARVYDELHGLYMAAYDLRKQREYALTEADAVNEVARINDSLKSVYRTIHQYYEPLPHRKMLHDILGSMEVFQIDQLMDTTASKNATLLPLDVMKSDRTEDDYINFRMAALDVPNNAKYLQVETSGVKDKAKHSVQSKLLLPANIADEEFRRIIEIEARKAGQILNEDDILAIENMKTSLNQYQLSLRQATKARLLYFTEVMRKGNDFELGKIFTMIRESLQLQNAPKNILDMFAVKPDGKPVFSPNLSLVRTTLEYYLIAQYSKNVTDEKVSGFKNFHESSFGYDVLVDPQTNEVITTEEYANNPDAFKDRKLRSRPLSITTEIQEDGSKLYFVEAIIPKPFFENEQQETFFKENLTKMFGVRIPTEDKRSMIAIKVVDYVDSSKLNNIIVPHFVHLLSGSDFDIDSLFGRMMSYYKNGIGNYNLYGDYSQYKDPSVGRFIEFMHYMSKHEDIGPLIKQRKKELVEQGTIEIPSEGALFSIIDNLGYTIEDVAEFFDQKLVKSKYAEQKDFTSYMFELTKESKDFYVKAKEIAEQNPENRELAKTRNVYGRELADLKAVRQKAVEDQRRTKRKLQYIDLLFDYQSIMDVLAKFNMPANVSDFNSRPAFSEMVSPRYQNQNLAASLQILGNEAVFKYLYINQRSSTQEFKDILDRFGIDLKAITKKSNLFTPTNMIESKVENNMNKDGIGRTAVMNKFLSLASQYNLKLSDKGIIWMYQTLDKGIVLKDTFGQLNEQEQRVIAIIGNILGMFADGAKDPIPAALQMNEVNASTTLAMIGVGLDPEFAVAFNFLPEVRKAALAVQQSQFALSEDLDQEYKFYNTAIKEQLADLIENNPEAFDKLKSVGFFTEKSYKDFTVVENPMAVRIGFEPKKLSLYALKNNELTPSAIGFEMVYDKTEEQLSEDEMKMVLLSYYAKQAQQTWSINRAASVTNLFKRLNPSLVTFDKMRDNVEELLEEERLFTKESVAALFAEDQVWSVLKDTLDDANEQFSKIFLERTPFFDPITRTFKGYFEDPKTISNTLTSFLALNKFKMTFPGSRKFDNAIVQSIIDKDDEMILKTFSPEYWFTNDLFAQVEKFREKYPNNEFLKLLRSADSKNTATVIYNGKTYQGINERFITMISKAKIKGDYASKIADDIAYLYNSGMVEERQFIKNLFYHDLVRTGLQYKEGSFIAYMPAELKVPVSNYIEEFIQGIQNTISSPNFEESFETFIKEYTGETSQTGVIKFFDEMFNQIAYAAASETNNQKIPKFKNKGSKGKMNVRSVVFTISFKNPQFSKPIVKAFLDTSKKIDGEALLDARLKSINYVLDALNLPTPTDVDLTKAETLEIASKFKEQFSINLSGNNQKANETLGKMFGIQKDMSQPDSAEFVFPSILKLDSKTYILQGVDGNAESGKSLGSNLYDSILGKTVMTNVGTYAKYVAIPEQYASDALSPIGFSKENADAYKRYIDKKEAIVFNTNVVDTSKKQDNVGTTVNENIPDEQKDPTENVIIGQDPSKEQLEKNGSEIVEGVSSEEGASKNQLEFGDSLLDQLLKGVMGQEVIQPEVPKIQRGRYVIYKGKTYIVTQQNDNGTWQIYNPLLEGAAAKLQVAEANIKPLDMLAKIVEYKDSEYIVTSKNTIISLKTNKRMMWGETDGNRKAILALAAQNGTIIKPNNRPSIDPTDENNC